MPLFSNVLDQMIEPEAVGLWCELCLRSDCRCATWLRSRCRDSSKRGCRPRRLRADRSSLALSMRPIGVCSSQPLHPRMMRHLPHACLVPGSCAWLIRAGRQPLCLAWLLFMRSLLVDRDNDSHLVKYNRSKCSHPQTVTLMLFKSYLRMANQC
jgi:hypothetical protein